LEASDLVQGKDNPFDNNNAGFKKYLTGVAAAKARNDYYNIDRKVQELFNDPNNMQRNQPGYRQEVLDKAKAQKSDILAGNMALQISLGTSQFEARRTLKMRFEHLDQMITNPKYKKSLDEGAVYTLVTQIMPMTKRVIAVFNDVGVRQQYQGQQALDNNLAVWTSRMEELTNNNPILSEAYISIIKPYIDDLYTIPTAALSKGN